MSHAPRATMLFRRGSRQGEQCVNMLARQSRRLLQIGVAGDTP
jgi:hypothetical protein